MPLAVIVGTARLSAGHGTFMAIADRPGAALCKRCGRRLSLAHHDAHHFILGPHGNTDCLVDRHPAGLLFYCLSAPGLGLAAAAGLHQQPSTLCGHGPGGAGLDRGGPDADRPIWPARHRDRP